MWQSTFTWVLCSSQILLTGNLPEYFHFAQFPTSTSQKIWQFLLLLLVFQIKIFRTFLSSENHPNMLILNKIPSDTLQDSVFPDVLRLDKSAIYKPAWKCSLSQNWIQGCFFSEIKWSSWDRDAVITDIIIEYCSGSSFISLSLNFYCSKMQHSH